MIGKILCACNSYLDIAPLARVGLVEGGDCRVLVGGTAGANCVPPSAGGFVSCMGGYVQYHASSNSNWVQWSIRCPQDTADSPERAGRGRALNSGQLSNTLCHISNVTLLGTCRLPQGGCSVSCCACKPRRLRPHRTAHMLCVPYCSSTLCLDQHWEAPR